MLPRNLHNPDRVARIAWPGTVHLRAPVCSDFNSSHLVTRGKRPKPCSTTAKSPGQPPAAAKRRQLRFSVTQKKKRNETGVWVVPPTLNTKKINTFFRKINPCDVQSEVGFTIDANGTCALHRAPLLHCAFSSCLDVMSGPVFSLCWTQSSAPCAHP